jgi:hypothetical protein
LQPRSQPNDLGSRGWIPPADKQPPHGGGTGRVRRSATGAVGPPNRAWSGAGVDTSARPPPAAVDTLGVPEGVGHQRAGVPDWSCSWHCCCSEASRGGTRGVGVVRTSMTTTSATSGTHRHGGGTSPSGSSGGGTAKTRSHTSCTSVQPGADRRARVLTYGHTAVRLRRCPSKRVRPRDHDGRGLSEMNREFVSPTLLAASSRVPSSGSGRD